MGIPGSQYSRDFGNPVQHCTCTWTAVTNHMTIVLLRWELTLPVSLFLFTYKLGS